MRKWQILAWKLALRKVFAENVSEVWRSCITFRCKHTRKASSSQKPQPVATVQKDTPDFQLVLDEAMALENVKNQSLVYK